jgi:hypothetical protein
LRAGPHAGTGSTTSSRTGNVFREAEVERLLYAYLREAGYRVLEKVRVPSGIVDAIATRDGEVRAIGAREIAN